jgi:hypothetical protein
MRKFLLCCGVSTFLLSCNNNDANKTAASTSQVATTDSVKPAVALPYTASYSSSFTADVSDADLITVMMSYKDWADGSITNVAKAYGDTLEWDKPSGDHYKLPNAGIMKMWGTYRDSLSSITLDMEAWHKMYSTDKKDSMVVTWYKETDTYKNGKADSGYYQDINVLKSGKIVYLGQYKRAAK